MEIAVQTGMMMLGTGTDEIALPIAPRAPSRPMCHKSRKVVVLQLHPWSTQRLFLGSQCRGQPPPL